MSLLVYFVFNYTAHPEIYTYCHTLSLHDALPICSAAALAAGMGPAAVGTQTVASVNRPAAYCGIAAVKPSTRALSTFGIAPLSPAYDTPGLFGSTVADAALLFEAICPDHLVEAAGGGRPRVIVLDDPFLGEAEAEILAARDAAGARMRARSEEP